MDTPSIGPFAGTPFKTKNRRRLKDGRSDAGSRLRFRAETIASQGFSHLRVRVHGKHLVIYSEYEGEKENRARLTMIKQQFYNLGVVNHRGTWQPTPYTGSVTELTTLLIEQFALVLGDF